MGTEMITLATVLVASWKQRHSLETIVIAQAIFFFLKGRWGLGLRW